MNSIGPVVANRRRLAVFIVGENQSVFRFAAVIDRDYETCSGVRAFRKVDMELSVFVREGNWLASLR